MYNNIINELNKNIEKGRLGHCYIFSGIKNIGKKETAFEFAKNIICEDEISKTKFDNNNHPDFQYICPDDKNTIKIETIRNMIKDINIKPIESEYKVYVINDADLITTQAQNALLKTLEEPPQYVVIILITSNYYSVIDTIRSRSQKITFNKIDNEEVLNYITEHNIDIDIDKELLLFLINGRIGYIDKIEEDQDIINDLYEFIEDVENMDLIEVYTFSQEFLEYKENIFNILDYMINIYGYILKNDKTKKVSSIENSIEYIEKCKKNIKGNINFEIAIDNLFQNLWEEWNA